MECDVLVIGAGPAGSALATQLATAGHEVVLADRKDFPRSKPCGEFLSPQCLPYLEELGLGAATAALGPRLVRGMQLNGYGATALGRFRQVGDRPAFSLAGFGIRRERFDHMLQQRAVAAGARWLPRHDGTELHRAADGRIDGARLRGPDGAPLDIRARWVVGADGVHSRVARDLGVQRPVPWLDQFALVAHFRGVPSRPFAEVHLVPGGFFAATTVDDEVFSVNLVVPRHTLRDRHGADWDGFVANHFDAAPGMAERLRGATRDGRWRGIGPLAHTTTAQTFAGAALVGDACGYVDPLTGEGIYFSLFGAKALGDALQEAFANPAGATAAMAGYTAARRAEVGPRLWASIALQRALRYPWLVRTFLRRAARWPALADLVVTLTGDTVHPRDLLSPSFWRGFRQARPA